MRCSIALLGVLVMSSSGCSMLFMRQAPPEDYRGPVDDCTSSVAAPVIDTIFAISYVSSGIFWLTQEQVSATLISTGMAILVIGSASTGYSSADRCSRLKYRAREADYRYGPFREDLRR